MVITKTLSFDSAHMLSFYDGKCGNLHGHTYRATIEIDGDIDERSRMVLDYNRIKEVFEPFDHAIIFSGADLRGDAEDALVRWAMNYEKAYYCLPNGYKCTAEDMARYFALKVRQLFDSDKVRVQVFLSETPGSTAVGVNE